VTIICHKLRDGTGGSCGYLDEVVETCSNKLKGHVEFIEEGFSDGIRNDLWFRVCRILLILILYAMRQSVYWCCVHYGGLRDNIWACNVINKILHRQHYKSLQKSLQHPSSINYTLHLNLF
jgi:hypothetical protein